ncbi:MAG TPA: divalent metal cation transporter [Gemmatimonadales bacterium]|nr:divalent metal cation transporter [Gemmatimonadales bacterium]
MTTQKTGRLRRLLSTCGPGIVSGAADDDPSGIGTYSIAGAQFGTAFLWTALLTWPLMAVVQMTCARIGMVTGRGLMAGLRQRFPRWALLGVALALFLANTFNVGADLAAMGEAGTLLVPAVPAGVWVFVCGIGITWATIEIAYANIARVLEGLALVLFAYVITAALVVTDWGAVLRAAVTPRIPGGGWATLVAILGTTISPYLFFWQASEEVEEEKARGRRFRRQRTGATARELADRRLDVASGAFFSELVMFFIILTTAVTLHEHGVTSVRTGAEAARALRPLAGRFAELLYALGIFGTGLLAIPTLTASAAYAAAEIFGWRQGLSQPFRRARAFYGVVILATVAGIALQWVGLDPLHALFYSAVVNGVLAPLLLAAILVVARDATLMQGQPSPRVALVVLGAATLLMGAGVVVMFATL